MRQDMLYGFTLAAGYEYMRPGSFFARACLSATLLTGEIYVTDQSRVTPTFSLAVGLKIL